jgi:hypothetical protein
MGASFQKLFSSRSAIGYVKDPVSTTLPVFLPQHLSKKHTNKHTNTKTNKMGRLLPQQFGKLWL